MTSLTEICNLLGHSWDGLESTGRPKFILKHLEDFSRNWTGIKDQRLVGKFFLDHQGKKLFGHPECKPKLPEHHDE